MRQSVAVVYNQPDAGSIYKAAGENAAEFGVLEAVGAVESSLLELGYQVVMVPLQLPLEAVGYRLRELHTGLIFNLFEGFSGQPETEAELAGMISETGIPFTGCHAQTLRLCLDKVTAKVVLKAGGIPAADYQLLDSETLGSFNLGFPCIVKPRGEDASHGLSEKSVVYDFNSLREQIRRLSLAYEGPFLLEKFIGGREFNVTVIGNKDVILLPVSEIAYSLPEGMPRILTYSAKWEPDSLYYRCSQVICPAQLEPDIQERINRVAVESYRVLGCCGYARVDMRADEQRNINVIEVNPNPDISPGAGAVLQAAAAGMTYTQFINKIIQLALEWNDNERKNSPDDQRRQAVAHANIAAYPGIQARGSSGSRRGH